MRIGVDCRLSGPQHAGIGRYITNLITRLPTLDSKTTWVYFIAEENQAQDLTKFSNVEVVLTPIKHYSLAEQLRLPKYFKQAKLDLLHVPHFNVPVNYSGNLLITIHDLLWHEYRGSQVTTLAAGVYWLKYLAYRWVSTKAIKKARRILVPTQVIKHTIGTYYPESIPKTFVTHEGVSGDFLNRNKNKDVLTKLPKNKKILLYVGSLYPHKNISLVVSAMKHLDDYHLVIVGARNVFQNQIRHQAKNQKVTDRVSFLGYLGDKDLATVMSQSEALLQPSLSEGFGLTGIEAMAASLPVIASQIPVFQEIYGKAALFFDPQSSDSFIKAVHTLATSDRKKIILEGQAQSHQYSWDKMASETLTHYQQVLSATT